MGYGSGAKGDGGPAIEGDSGGASRFFYCAKTSRAEREAGLEGFDLRTNHHPTVKPINLMGWLTRLVTPPGGLILDPFLGSGSTGCAAVLEGFDFLGIEGEPEYVAIAEARIAFWAQHEGREVKDVLKDKVSGAGR
jgi:site-specific DNA-methyltransferase (adenine-specific)